MEDLLTQVQLYWGDNGMIGRRVKNGTGWRDYFVTTDSFGSVAQIIRADTGIIVARYNYDAFGVVTKRNGSVTGSDQLDKDQVDQQYRFQSHWRDTMSGLSDFGFRFYSPGLGRFVNQDPLEEEGGINLYGFVGGNPTNSFDLDGLYPVQGGAFDISGGSKQEQAKTEVNIGIMCSTPKGKGYLSRIRKGVKTVYVYVGHFGGAAGEDQQGRKGGGAIIPIMPDPSGQGRGNEIWVDPTLDTNPRFKANTTAGKQFYPYDVQIAHEVGHVVYGIGDVGAGRMANVNIAEIPYRAQRRRQLLGRGVKVGSAKYNQYAPRTTYP